MEPPPPCLNVKRGREELLLRPNEKQGRRLGAEYLKLSLPWLDFSLPYQMVMERGSGWLWGSSHDATVVVGCRVHKRKAGEGLGPKNLKSSFGGSVSGMPCEMAMEGMGEGGGMVQMRPWWWWGCVFANASGGRGFGAENLKLSAQAWFRAASVQTLLKWVAVRIQQPITWLSKGQVGVWGELVWWKGWLLT